jgi:hypothetical protein
MTVLYDNVIGGHHSGYILEAEEINALLEQKYPESTYGKVDFNIYVGDQAEEHLQKLLIIVVA